MEVIDVFCGAGLFSAGMERAGLEIILGIDNNKIALDSFSLNFPGAVVWETDIMDIRSLPKSDIIIGGVPCQNFSLANRDPDLEKGIELLNKFLELVKCSNPKYWIMEEVPEVETYIKDKVPRIEIIDCSIFGSKNLRPRLFAGDYPDPVKCYPKWTGPEKTVMASDSTLPIEVMKDLQDVPSWMKFTGSDTDISRQIGNGVPLKVGESLGTGIMYFEAGRVATGHKDWHKTTASYRRDRTIQRSYRSVPGWRYCEVCQTNIKID